MKRLVRFFAFILCLTIIFTGCGDSTQKPEESSGETGSSEQTDTPEAGAQELIFVLHNEPDGIDPNVTSNSFASPFLTNCFEGLVTYNENSELVPGLAESWDISEDGKTYTFRLRKDLKWSDGSPLTSKDFLYSIHRVLKPETAAQYLSMVTDYIENAQDVYDGKKTAEELGVQTPDDHTLVMKLKDPAPFFIDILSMNVFVPVQQAAVEAHPEKWTLSPETYITNGPFKITQMNMGESVVLEKNPNYYNADTVSLEKITFRYIKDQATALNAFQSGEIDGFREIPSADLAKLKAESDDLYTIAQYATTYYLINTAKPPYDDTRVRKAINLAIDRRALIDNVLQGSGEPAYALVSPGYSAEGTKYEEGRGDYGITASANPEEAKKLMAEAGYPDGKGFPTIQLSYYTHPQVKQVVEAMAQMLKTNLGVEVEISTEEWKVYYDNVQAGKYEIAAMGWGADYLHPMTFLPLFVGDDPLNNSAYANPAYDEAVAAAKIETDAKKAIELMRKAEDIMMQDYPFLPLYHRSTSLMMKPYVKGWYMTPTASLYLRNVKIEGK
ncbi:MAG: peptide ABC transporter substrate-binding protein [Peptostreptococcaceae bacterium]|nr:peptide ABC transporter substrate-binding protein [Peptostreptococcaceae bacterium]